MVGNKRYFETEQGRGYFVRLERLIENMGLITLKQMEVEKEVQSAQQDIALLSKRKDDTENDDNTRTEETDSSDDEKEEEVMIKRIETMFDFGF